MAHKNSLGKGLGAILPDLIGDLDTKPLFIMCGIEELYPNRFQPRKDFNDQGQQQLVASVKKSGIIQPIVVRKTEKGYEIIAGERRWRAAQSAGLLDVPIIIREAEDMEVAELSLIENIQREELNAIEEASAYQTLVDRFNLSHEEISSRVGKDRSTIVNTIRLLKLPGEIKEALIQKKITTGHARSLLSAGSQAEQISTLHLVTNKDLTVRETERLIKRLKDTAKEKTSDIRDSHILDMEKRLSSRMMVPVRINYGKRRGVIQINFRGNKEMNRLIAMLIGT